MIDTQGSLPAGDAEQASFEDVPNVPSSPSAAPDGEGWGDPGIGDGISQGEHTLLARSSAPQGRRSLFRR